MPIGWKKNFCFTKKNSNLSRIWSTLNIRIDRLLYIFPHKNPFQKLHIFACGLRFKQNTYRICRSSIAWCWKLAERGERGRNLAKEKKLACPLFPFFTETTFFSNLKTFHFFSSALPWDPPSPNGGCFLPNPPFPSHRKKTLISLIGFHFSFLRFFFLGSYVTRIVNGTQKKRMENKMWYRNICATI